MRNHDFNEAFIKELGSLEAVKEWSKGRHDEAALVAVWDKVKPTEVKTAKKKATEEVK
jgi:hypothetical protein